MRRWMLFALAMALLVACRGSGPTAEELLDQSAEVMSEVETLSFTIEREGEPVLLSEELGASLVGAEGVYQSPDSVYALVDAQMATMTVEAEFMWVGEMAYYRLPPLIPDFTEIDLAGVFEANEIFDAEDGLPMVMRDLENPELNGKERLEGLDTYYISAEADAAELGVLTGGALPPGTTGVEIWINADTDEVVQITLTESEGEKWHLYLYDFGEPVEMPDL